MLGVRFAVSISHNRLFGTRSLGLRRMMASSRVSCSTSDMESPNPSRRARRRLPAVRGVVGIVRRSYHRGAGRRIRAFWGVQPIRCAPTMGRQTGTPVGSARAMGRQGGPKGSAHSLRRFGGAMPQMRIAAAHIGKEGGSEPPVWRRISYSNLLRKCPRSWSESCARAQVRLLSRYRWKGQIFQLEGRQALMAHSWRTLLDNNTSKCPAIHCFLHVQPTTYAPNRLVEVVFHANCGGMLLLAFSSWLFASSFPRRPLRPRRFWVSARSAPR